MKLERRTHRVNFAARFSMNEVVIDKNTRINDDIIVIRQDGDLSRQVKEKRKSFLNLINRKCKCYTGK